MLAHFAGAYRARVESYGDNPSSEDGWSCRIHDLVKGDSASSTYLVRLAGESTSSNITNQEGASTIGQDGSADVAQVKRVVDQGILSWTVPTIPNSHPSTLILMCDIVSITDSEGSSESFRSLGPVPSTLLWDGVRRCLNMLLSTSQSHNSTFTTLLINIIASRATDSKAATDTSTTASSGTSARFTMQRDGVETVLCTVAATEIMGLLPFALMYEKQTPVTEVDIPMLCPVITRSLNAILGSTMGGEAELLALVYCAERIETATDAANATPNGTVLLRREPLPPTTSMNNLALLALTRSYLVHDPSYGGDVVAGCTLGMALVWGILGTAASRRVRSRRWLNLFVPQAASLSCGSDLARLLHELQAPPTKEIDPSPAIVVTECNKDDAVQKSIASEGGDVAVGSGAPFDSMGDLPSNGAMGSLDFSPYSSPHDEDANDNDEAAIEAFKAPVFPRDMCIRLLAPIVASAFVDDTLTHLAQGFQLSTFHLLTIISPSSDSSATTWRSLLGSKRPREEEVVEVGGSGAAADESVLLFDLLAKRDTKPAPKRGGKKKVDPKKSTPDVPFSNLRGMCLNLKSNISPRTVVGTAPFQEVVWSALQSMGDGVNTSGTQQNTKPVCSLVTVIPTSSTPITDDDSDTEDGDVPDDLVVVKIDFERLVGVPDEGSFMCYIVGLGNNIELLQSFEVNEQMMVPPSGIVTSEGASADPMGLSCSLPASLSPKASLLQSVQIRYEDHLVATSHPVQVLVSQREKDASKFAYHTYDERGTSMKVEAYIPPPLDVDPQGTLAVSSILASYSGRQDMSAPTSPTEEVDGFPTTTPPPKRGLTSAHYTTRIPRAASYSYVSCIVVPTGNAPVTPHLTLSQRFANYELSSACSNLVDMGLFGKNSISAQNARAQLETSDGHRVIDTSHLLFDGPPLTTTWEYGTQISEFLSSRCVLATVHKRGGGLAAYLRTQLQCHLSSSRPHFPLADALKLLQAQRLLKPQSTPPNTRRGKSVVPRLVDASRALSVVYGRALRTMSGAPPTCPIQARMMAFVFMVLSGDQLPEKDAKVGIFNRPDSTELDPNARPTLRQLFRGGVLSRVGVQDVLRTAANQMGGSSLASLLTGNAGHPNTAAMPSLPSGRSVVDGMMCVVKDSMIFGSFLDHTYFLPPPADSSNHLPPLFAEGGCPETTQIQLAWVLLQVVVGRLDRLRMLIEADGHSQSILSVVSSQLIEVHVLQWAASRFALSADPTTGRVSSPQCTEGYLVPPEVRQLFEYGSSLCSSFGQTV